MANTFKVNDIVILPAAGRVKGKVKQIDGDDVFVKWNGGTLVSPEGENWVPASDLELFHRP
ncbi:hypothetical protein [Stackebrandtia nassauensis]|uniref:DUF1918 domain-containing protein n=1 Tax=Stackebrandtia nassauensis (strain DSM 44728 / CIP 108903 / NRRL B-16338 / NBRC 102104 / LLR-40K-21) TaxID=446470 RepID=D3Q3Z4_STANL|nr:hypothetical protein [Stackebrandtia nassauensis]ADD45879.1 hypothetical protein Snas_6259 [Stackebrandtia nassauensis DSM 44728]